MKTTNDTNSYTWDRANRLLSMGGASYAYDGLNNRVQQTVGATVTKYLLDLQPGLAVVLAETTGSDTIRNVHAPRGIHAHKDASGAWEWMVQDGLGSVRGVVDNSVGVLESRNYDPYGELFGATGSSQTDYGFTGEQTDANGLLYLRARYYNPAAGVFTALDPFEGMATRPMSLNGYSWVEGNVPNMTDPSGTIPDENEIKNAPASDPAYTYSCHCGWIDWKHADPARALKVLNLLRDVATYFKNHPTISSLFIRGQDIQHQISVAIAGVPILENVPPQDTFVNYVEISSALNESNLAQVALGLYQKVEERHESSLESSLSTFTSTWTNFAEEDLTSDLISFYRALDEHNWDKSNAFHTLAPICGYPDDFEQSKQWSLDVIATYGSFERVYTWESPRLHDTPAIRSCCGGGTRRWPWQLSTIDPNNEIWGITFRSVAAELAGSLCKNLGSGNTRSCIIVPGDNC